MGRLCARSRIAARRRPGSLSGFPPFIGGWCGFLNLVLFTALCLVSLFDARYFVIRTGRSVSGFDRRGDDLATRRKTASRLAAAAAGLAALPSGRV
jgi:hypothetical protein